MRWSSEEIGHDNLILVYSSLSADSVVLSSPSFCLFCCTSLCFFFSLQFLFAICPTSCSLFVLMCLFWCLFPLNPTSLFCLAPRFLHRNIVDSFLSLSLSLCHGLSAHTLSAMPHPASPPYSHVHIDPLPCPPAPPAAPACPALAPDAARVATVESWKCSSCLIRRYNGGRREDGREKRRDTRASQNSHPGWRFIDLYTFGMMVSLDLLVVFWKVDITCKSLVV